MASKVSKEKELIRSLLRQADPHFIRSRTPAENARALADELCFLGVIDEGEVAAVAAKLGRKYQDYFWPFEESDVTAGHSAPPWITYKERAESIWMGGATAIALVLVPVVVRPRTRLSLGHAIKTKEYEVTEKQNLGAALTNLAVDYLDLGRVQRGIECVEQALQLAREVGDRHGEGVQLGNLGLCYRHRGEVGRAIEHHEQALAISREIGDRRLEGIQLGHLGLCYQVPLLDEVGRAIEYHEQALAISREIPDRRGEGNALGNLGLCYRHQHEVERAIECLEQALAITREIGDRQGEAAQLGNLGLCYLSLGDLQRAIEHHEQALAISQGIGDRRGEGRDLRNLGNAFIQQERFDRALPCWLRSADILRQIQSPDSEKAEQSILKLRQQLGDEAARLEAEVRPRLDEIIEEILAEARQALQSQK